MGNIINVKSPARILNKQGKANRSIGKILNLASTYGMSGSTAGAKLGYSGAEAKQKGEKLLENFFKDFKGLKKAIDDSKDFLRKNGYVEDFLGRRRRLPEINLSPYEVSLKNKKDNYENFNPIIGCTDRITKDPAIIKWENKVAEAVAKSQNYQRNNALKQGKIWEENKEMSNVKYEKLAKDALKDGVIISANTGRIAQAERQCFNARVQGSAASLSKLAMVDIYNDKELNDYKAKLIIPVHDELLVECPAYYAEKVEKRLPEVMINAAKRGGDNVPQACDPYNVSRWASDVCAAYILDEFKKLQNKGMSKDEALDMVLSNHSEYPIDSILKVLHGETQEIDF